MDEKYNKSYSNWKISFNNIHSFFVENYYNEKRIVENKLLEKNDLVLITPKKNKDEILSTLQSCKVINVKRSNFDKNEKNKDKNYDIVIVLKWDNKFHLYGYMVLNWGVTVPGNLFSYLFSCYFRVIFV